MKSYMLVIHQLLLMAMMLGIADGEKNHMAEGVGKIRVMQQVFHITVTR